MERGAESRMIGSETASRVARGGYIFRIQMPS
jgi:hypothetical protein